MKQFFYVLACMCIMSCSNSTEEKTVDDAEFETNEITVEADSLNASSDTEAIESEETNEATVSSTDWDKTIDEYEKYIDEYIKFVKKGQSGDVTALTKSLELMEKAESVSNKLENVKEEELTKDQLKRFMNIQTKLVDAM